MQIVELPDGGGTIIIPPNQANHSATAVDLSTRRTRAKRALSSFLNGLGSPFLQPTGDGNIKLAVS